MRTFAKRISLTAIMIGIAGCSTIDDRALVGSIVAGAANTQVGYSTQQCMVVKSRCVEGDYQEWQTSDGKPGCSCKDFSQ